MATAADSAEGIFTSKAWRALGFASSFAICLLTGGVLAITLFGHPKSSIIAVEIRPLGNFPNTIGAALMASPTTRENPVTAVTKAIYAGKVLMADPALIENTPLGPLPRISDDGRRPLSVYAASFPSGAKFKIALLVSGLGLSARATQSALATLPPQISLGFAPYAADVGQWVAQARARGHEILLEIPMEPLDFPDSDPGPNTLRTGQEEDTNIQRLKWALSRFTGYAGVTNLFGERFLSDSEALSPTLAYLARRGLYFFDNSNASQSQASTVAGQIGVPFAQSMSNIDAIPTAAEIDRRLSALEDEARTHGTAVGSAELYPVSITRIAAWAQGLQSRGFALVPVSAIVATKGQ